MPHLSLRLLGPIQVTLGGEPVTEFASDKVRALLAHLAVESRKPHRRESLAGLLWADQPERAARANLRRALADLRRAIGDHEAEPPFLLISRQTIEFNLDADAFVDVSEFNALTTPQATPQHLETAVAMYHGRFLEGFSVSDAAAFEEWSLLQREHLDRQMSSSLRRLIEHYEASHEHDAALAHAWRLVELDAVQEDAHRRVMRLLALTGQRSSALAQYETIARILEEDLGLAPDDETDELRDRIRIGELVPVTSRPAHEPISTPEEETVGACPYRGLAAFREADAPLFHGREEFIERLLDVVEQDSRIAVVVGSSGSGKTSAVFAGLLPRARQNEWAVVACRPGPEPFQALAVALLSALQTGAEAADRIVDAPRLATSLHDGEVELTEVVERLLASKDEARRLLLVVDQAEELFTLCPDQGVRRRFLDLLCGFEGPGPILCPQLVVLANLRADFMGHALTHRGFAKALQHGSVMMGPMRRDELRSAIERPADHQNARFEPGLVDRLLDDVGDEPGNLPLLEFALTLLWERQSAGELTHEGYEHIGRVDGALANYAEQVFAGLTEGRQRRARLVFEQLVRPGEGTEDSRRLATRAELGEEGWKLAQQLADERLVVTGRDAAGRETAEVVHEALIQRWGRLQGWMDADRAFRTWQEGLRSAVRTWGAADHDEGALLRGAPLTQAESWLADRGPELGDDERGFILASTARRERGRAETERRRRLTILALAGGLLVALVLAAIALTARSSARREAAVSRSIALAADAEQALASGQPDVALALALEAVDIDDPPSEAQLTLSAIAQEPGTKSILAGHQSPVGDAALSPDGRWALSGGCEDIGPTGECAVGELILWNLEQGVETARLEGHRGGVTAVAFGPDGETAYSGSDDGTLVQWDLSTEESVRQFAGHRGRVTTIAVDSDGRTVLTGSADATLIRWDVDTGDVIERYEGHDGGVTTVRFGPELPDGDAGRTALSASVDASVILWEVSTGDLIRRFEGHQNAVTDVALHPDGRTILTVSDDLSLRAWDVETGEQTASHGFGTQPKSIAITPDGRTALVSVKNDIRQWDIGRWLETGRLPGHGIGDDQDADITSIVVDRAGQVAVSAGSDATVRVWNLGGHVSPRRLDTGGTPMEAVAVSSDGGRLLTGMATGEVLLWDAELGRVIRRLSGDGVPVSPSCLAFSPASAVVAAETRAVACAEDPTGATDATSLVVWNLDTGQEVRRFEGHVSYVRAVAFTPDGRAILAGSQSLDPNPLGDLILWDVETGLPIRRLDVTHDIADIEVSADGTRALTGSVTDFVAILWDVTTGAEIRRFEGHSAPVLNVVFGPEEATLLTASFDGTLILWDVETGEIIRRYLGHDTPVFGLDVSPGGRLAISSAQDGTVIVWDITTGEELHRLTAHTSGVFDVAFGPDGGTAYSAGTDGELIEWQGVDKSLDELVEWVEANRYVPELTCAERDQYRLESSGCV